MILNKCPSFKRKNLIYNIIYIIFRLQNETKQKWHGNRRKQIQFRKGRLMFLKSKTRLKKNNISKYSVYTGYPFI